MKGIKARELVFDLFGDYVRYLGGEARLAVLTELLENFDVAAPAARVTLSRMRKEGWFETRRVGRETSYSMTEKLIQYLDAGHQRIFQPPIHAWVGKWTVVMLQIPETERARRDRLKRVLTWEGFGQLNSMSWISPRQNHGDVEELLGAKDDDQIDVFVLSTGSLTGDRNLAERCWDLRELHRWYENFLTRWDHYREVDLGRLTPREALILRVELIATYRQVLFLDPFLPRILQPKGWLGARAYHTFLAVHDRLAVPSLSFAAGLIEAEPKKM